MTWLCEPEEMHDECDGQVLIFDRFPNGEFVTCECPCHSPKSDKESK